MMPVGAKRRDLVGGSVVRQDLAVHAHLADAARDQLRVLAAEVHDQDTLAVGRLLALPGRYRSLCHHSVR